MSQSNPIRILIVDDHAMVRSGLEMFLLAYDDLQLAGEAGNGMEALDLAGKLKPDVILMDIFMPSMDGVQATSEIHSKYPDIKIIVLTSFTEPQLIHDAINAGVSGYLSKNTTANELSNAIRSVYAGNTIFSPEVTQSLMNQPTLTGSKFHNLTAREKEILTMMTSGKSNTEISKQLTISLSTIKFHVSNILSKLNARSRGEAVSIAVKNHLLD
jgi:two-component system, NarL family, response regulator LiaR